MLEPTVRWLRALSDATRLRILRLLAREELNVAELCGILSLPQPTVSRHLAQLREAGLLKDRRDGTSVYYAPAGTGPGPAERQAWEALRPALDGAVGADRDVERLTRVMKRRSAAARRHFDAGSDGSGTRQSRFGDLVAWRSLAGLLPRDSVIVDLGAGTGDLLPFLAGRAGRVVALDFSSRMLALARSRAAALDADVTFVRGELEAVPLRSGSADGVVASLVLHHAARPAAAIREMARVLRPGGRAVVVDFLPHREDWLREEEGDVWLGFEPAAVTAWLKAAGFRNVIIEEGPAPERSGRRNRPGADRRLKRLSLLWAEAEKPRDSPRSRAPRGAAVAVKTRRKSEGAGNAPGKVRHR